VTAALPAHRGERLGLPATGSGAIASVDRRLGAFAVDCLASFLVAALFTAGVAHHRGVDALPGSWSIVPLFLDYAIGLPLAGRTLGMNLVGLRAMHVSGVAPSASVTTARVSVLDAALRAVLLVILVPALIWDRDQRGLHDRVARTVIVRT
jgi:uncharacterized RDD family membrane protein YckC